MNVTVFANEAPEHEMPEAHLKELRDDADKNASAAHLPALKDGDPDEIRLWVTWATFNPYSNGIATRGYLFAGITSEICSLSYRGASYTPSGSKCRKAPGRLQRQTLADLVPLSRLAGLSIDCGVNDGAWVLIDGVSRGKRFVLWAGNPGFCAGDAAKLVARVLDRLP